MEDIYRYVSPLSWKTFIPEHFTLEAYQTIFVEHGFGKALLNSLLIALVTVAVGILFNGMAGYAFAKFTFPGKKPLFLLVLLSYMVPFELISINLYAMMIDLKWIDTYLALIVPCIPNGMIIFLFRQYFTITGALPPVATTLRVRPENCSRMRSMTPSSIPAVP